MRSFIIGLALCLSACGGYDGVSQVQVEQDIAKAPNQATGVSALQAQVASLNKQMSNVQIIGQLKKPGTEDFRKMGEPIVESVSQATPFGACPNMGIFQGRGGSDSSNPVGSQFEIYKNCTGVYASYNDSTGHHDIPPYVTWDGPNCTGHMYIETDVPQNTFASSILQGGIVFDNPIDATAWFLAGGQTPQPITIQSAINTRGGVCGPDNETRMVITAVPNNGGSASNVPDTLVPGSWSNVAP